MGKGGEPSHRIGEVGDGLSLLVQLEEGRQVDDVLLQQAQLLLEDVPVPVDAALQGTEQSRIPPLPAGFGPRWGGRCHQKCGL